MVEEVSFLNVYVLLVQQFDELLVLSHLLADFIALMDNEQYCHRFK